MTTAKLCKYCDTYKQITMFPKWGNTCKDCMCVKSREYYILHKDKKQKQYRENRKLKRIPIPRKPVMDIEEKKRKHRERNNRTARRRKLKDNIQILKDNLRNRIPNRNIDREFYTDNKSWIDNPTYNLSFDYLKDIPMEMLTEQFWYDKEDRENELESIGYGKEYTYHQTPFDKTTQKYLKHDIEPGLQPDGSIKLYSYGE